MFRGLKGRFGLLLLLLSLSFLLGCQIDAILLLGLEVKIVDFGRGILVVARGVEIGLLGRFATGNVWHAIIGVAPRIAAMGIGPSTRIRRIASITMMITGMSIAITVTLIIVLIDLGVFVGWQSDVSAGLDTSLQVELDVVLVLLALILKFAVNLLLEAVHVLGNALLDSVLDEGGHLGSHVVRDLLLELLVLGEMLLLLHRRGLADHRSRGGGCVGLVGAGNHL